MVARRYIARTSELVHDGNLGELPLNVLVLGRRAARACFVRGMARDNAAQRELGERESREDS
jgi:hypothetical protein